MSDYELLNAAYAAFNKRDIEAVLAYLRPDVEWANGMEGGFVHGHSAVRDYWTRQWSEIDPRVEPQGFRTEDDGEIVVDVHQVVHDKAGNLLVDQRVEHLYRIENGLVKRMRIRTPP